MTQGGGRFDLAPRRAFEPGDSVITPSGETASVRRVLADGRLLLAYTEALPGAEREVELQARLVTKMVPGLLHPQPVRIDAEGRKVPPRTFTRRR